MAANHTTPVDSGAAELRKRHQPGTTTQSLLDAAKKAETKVEQSLLVLWDDLPAWRQDNHYITSGYRAQSNSYARSLASLLHLHNESVNIWTHLLGAAGFALAAAWLSAVVAPRYAAATPADGAAFAAFFGGCVACLGMSATYHALCDHSEGVARWGNKLDYSGIVFCIGGSAVSVIYYGMFCHPRLMEFYMTQTLVLGVGCGIVSWVERFRTSEWRPYRAAMFVAFGLSNLIPIIHGWSLYGLRGLNERMGLEWVALSGALYVFGAGLYAARFPERTSPGTFDIWGSSHQIFHVLIVLAASSHLMGLVKAFDHHHSVMGSQC